MRRTQRGDSEERQSVYWKLREIANKGNRTLFKKRGESTCWICGFPVFPVPKNDRVHHGIRASVDHVGEEELRLAHAWCNSRRGHKDAPLTDQIRLTCRNHIKDKYRGWLIQHGVPEDQVK
jgi:hypothetical protein